MRLETNPCQVLKNVADEIRQRYGIDFWSRGLSRNWRRTGLGLVVFRKNTSPAPLNIGFTLGKAWVAIRWESL